MNKKGGRAKFAANSKVKRKTVLAFGAIQFQTSHKVTQRQEEEKYYFRGTQVRVKYQLG